MLVIGSTAMWRLLGDDLGRIPKDLDVFARPDSPYLTDNVTDRFWDDRLAGSQLDFFGFADLNQIYTIKHSHAYWELKNGSWDKHMRDLILLKKSGAVLDLELHKLLYDIWTDRHGKKKMNLAQAAGDFFDDAVVRIYDHDSIHRSTARRDHALYEEFLKPDQDVDMEMSKVWAAPFEIQVELFREEIAATALERWMIPTNYRFSPGLAWKLALKKTITSLTKGKSARFIVSNFDQFMKPSDNIDNETYIARHLRQKDRLILLNDKSMQRM